MRSPRALACASALLAACSGHDDDSNRAASGTSYALGSVVIDADGNRTTFVQVIDALDGPFDNSQAIEMPGNGVVMTHRNNIYVGLAEEPTWIRYTVDTSGKLTETGRMSFQQTGVSAIDYGNVIVDDTTAVSALSGVPSAVVWDPSTMTIKGEIDLRSLVRPGYSLEVWTTVVHDGLVYVPNRWADWGGDRIYPGVAMTILDPKAMTVVAQLEDDRCASGGRPVLGSDGNLYMMGDGRNYSIQMFANAGGGTAPDNCLLRIKRGETVFDPDYYYSIPSLTGGLQSITELDTAVQGSGFGLAKMFYPDQLPPGVEPVDFSFWDLPAHKMWRIELADPPTAVEVQGAPFASIGFDGIAFDGKYYNGETHGAVTDVYEIDPAQNTSAIRFTMDGYFYGLFRLQP